jgi:hypothetical protein
MLPWRIIRGIGRIIHGAGKVVVSGLGSFLRRVSDADVSQALNRVADKFEPVVVPVYCNPTGPSIDTYELEVDMSGLERALTSDRYVRPQLEIKAASEDIDRSVLSDQLIATFAVVLEQHEQRMEEVAAKRQRALERKAREVDTNLSDYLGSLILQALGVGIAGVAKITIGPLFWLLIAAGGVSVFLKLPDLLWKFVLRSLNYRIYQGPEDEELARLDAELQKYRPILDSLIENIMIIEDDDLKAKLASFQT